MNDTNTTLQELKNSMAQFVQERDWEQFHSPKNISMSIAIEAAELMEKFQFCDLHASRAEVEKNRTEIEHELADVFAYLLSFANISNIDLSKAFERKMRLNEQKYPAEKVKGSFAKAEELKKKFNN